MSGYCFFLSFSVTFCVISFLTATREGLTQIDLYTSHTLGEPSVISIKFTNSEGSWCLSVLLPLISSPPLTLFSLPEPTIELGVGLCFPSFFSEVTQTQAGVPEST